jgi:hypothetical protein
MNDETMVLADELAGLKARAEKLEADLTESGSPMVEAVLKQAESAALMLDALQRAVSGEEVVKLRGDYEAHKSNVAKELKRCELALSEIDRRMNTGDVEVQNYAQELRDKLSACELAVKQNTERLGQ